MQDIIAYIKEEFLEPLSRRATCRHEGEKGEYCSRCGSDIRRVASYECRVCSLMLKRSIYPADKAPDFCTRCGAPKFTFNRIRKKHTN